VFSHGYGESYSTASERVAHWKRDALLFDRVYARYRDSDAPPDIPIELSFGLDTVEQSLRAWDASMSVNADGSYGRWSYKVCKKLDEVKAKIDTAVGETKIIEIK